MATLSTTLVLVNIILGFIIAFLAVLLIAAICIVKDTFNAHIDSDIEDEFIFGYYPEDRFEKN